MNATPHHPSHTNRRWALAHALVFGLVGLIAAALGALRPESAAFADDLETRLIVVLGAVLIGLVQGRFLRQQVPGWARASLLGAALGAGLSLITEIALPDQPQGEFGPIGPPWSLILPVLWVPCVGLGIGLGQGWALRRHALRAASWVVASLLSWAVALPAAFIAYNLLSLPLIFVISVSSQFELHRVLTTGLFWLAFGATVGFMTFAFLQPRLHGPQPAQRAVQTSGPSAEPDSERGATLISPLQLWRRWLPAHLGAYVLAAILGGLVEFALEPNLFEPGPPYHTIGDQAIVAGLLIGGALAGVVQGRLLRRAIPNWWRASLLGALAGLAVTALTVWLMPSFSPGADAVAMGMPTGMFGQVTLWLVGLGLALGLAQWLALRRHYSRAAVWIAANLVATVVAVPGGWILSLMWGMPLAMMTTLIFSSAGVSHIGDVLGGVVVTGAGLISYGALVALITGLTLRWVLARPIASRTEAALGLAAQS